jgi:hypothetical protein
MSGHSKWATIKRKKGALDAKRGKLFTKLIKEITVASRMGGGGDLDGNARLRKAVNDAKSQSMPADTIKRAIQRGTGEIEGVNYEEIIYEGTGPGGTLFLCEGMTDNRNRTVAEIRKIFEKHNGALSAAGYRTGDMPRDSAALMERLLAGPSNARPQAPAEEDLPFPEYAVVARRIRQPGIEDRKLAVEPQRRARHQRLARFYAGTIDRVTGREVIAAIENDRSISD